MPGRSHEQSRADLTDEELVARCQSGDDGSFDILLERHEERVYNLAYRMMGSAEDAADVVQEAFVRVYNALPRFRGDAAFTTWLYRIATNVCIDETKRRGIRERGRASQPADDEAPDPLEMIADPHAAPQRTLEQHERQRVVQAAICQLPEHQRAVLVLYDILGFSYEEIAALLDTSLGTVKSRLNRARLALRSKLEPAMELFGFTGGRNASAPADPGQDVGEQT